MIITRIKEGSSLDRLRIQELRYFGTPGPTTLDKGSLTLGRSLDVPRISRYDVDTETPRPEKLVVDFDTTVNSSSTDISGRGNHLKRYGATYSAADKAYSFSGVAGTKYEGPAIGYLGGINPFSISIWFNSTDSSLAHQVVVGLGNYSGSPSNTMTGIRIKANGAVGVLHYNNDLLTTNAALFKYNTWNHVAYVFNGSTAVAEQKLYINGVSVAVAGSFHTGATLLTPANANFTLGSWAVDNTYPFKGLISQPKLYSVALEPSEVQKLYRLGRTGRSMVISDTAVGIGKVPEAQLDVRGNLAVRGVIQSECPAFSVTRSSGNVAGGDPPVAVSWNNIRTNRGGCYAATTGRFTAPISGLYFFSFFGMTSTAAAFGLQLRRNGAFVNHIDIWAYQHTGDAAHIHNHIHGSAIYDLNSGDYVQVHVQTGTLYGGTNAHNGFSGYFIG